MTYTPADREIGGAPLASTQDALTDPDATPSKPRRGRPPGTKAKVIAEQLRRHHFSFVRSAIEGIALRRAWETYLAFEGGADDERHFAARLRQLQTLIHQAASDRGLGAQAQRALARFSSVELEAATPAIPSTQAIPALPNLDEWVTQRCDELGIDWDFQTQADWLTEYEEAFGLDQPAPPQPASLALVELARPPLASPALPSLQDQLASLNSLSATLARGPALSDPLGSWLSADLTRRLSQVGVLTLQQLIGFINLYHHRWWTRVPRLGEVRGDRILAWLMPLAEELQHPLKEVACKPLMQLTLARASTLARLDPASQKRFGIVPLDRLAVPPEIDGRHGLFRIPGDNTLGVDTDLEAIFAWLRRHQESPRTSASYGRIVERFYLWCLWVQKKALSSLVEDDFHDYRRFLSKPPADWVQTQRAGREMAEWRPFKGALSQSSQRLNFSVISALLSGLISAGYIRANAAAGVLPAMKLQHFGLNIDRTFDDVQWSWVMQCWQALYDKCGPGASAESTADKSFLRAAGLRRTRLILELGATTGLRLIELVTTRRGALKREVVDGQAVWILKVVGKGFKPREVLVYDDIKALIDQHHRDMAMAGTGFDAKNPRVRALLNPDARLESHLRDGQSSAARPCPTLSNDGRADASCEVVSDSTQLPLIGALRKAPPKWALDGNGVAVMDRSAASNADRCGSLDPTALYQSLKRFLGTCCEQAEAAGAAIDHEGLGRASTHWLRHFFANSAAADNVMPAALMAAMGHSSLQTTSIYLRTERRLVVSEMCKMRRRG